jgi:hypothetical protein
MEDRIKSFINTSVEDTLIVDRIYKCLVRGRVSLCVIFNAKHIYDKYLSKKQLCAQQIHNSFLVFVCCAIISSKLYMDCSYTNESWTEICHFPVWHINRTENRILKEINYDVYLPYKNIEILYYEYGTSYDIKFLIKNNKECIRKKKKSFFKNLLKIFLCIGGV